MSNFFDGPRRVAGFHIYFYEDYGVQQTAQGFLSEAYLKYVEGKNLRRTQHIGKRSIYNQKLSAAPRPF